MDKFKILKLSKEDLESSIGGLSQIKPILQKQCLEVNLDGQGKQDAKELGEHFETAINAMVTVLGWMNSLNEDKVHELKTISKYFDAVCDGKKTFEVRKDDRNFQVGDTLRLKRYTDGIYDYAICDVKITYILGRNEYEKMYVPEGYVILGIK